MNNEQEPAVEPQLLPMAVTSFAFSKMKPSRFFDPTARALEWSVLHEQFGNSLIPRFGDSVISVFCMCLVCSRAVHCVLIVFCTAAKLKPGMPRLVFLVGPSGSGTTGRPACVVDVDVM